MDMAKDERKIIGELCTCGHTQKAHAAHFAPGHGPCTVPECKCAKYTWKQFIYEE